MYLILESTYLRVVAWANGGRGPFFHICMDNERIGEAETGMASDSSIKLDVLQISVGEKDERVYVVGQSWALYVCCCCRVPCLRIPTFQ